jgi:hypothetical protein
MLAALGENMVTSGARDHCTSYTKHHGPWRWHLESTAGCQQMYEAFPWSVYRICHIHGNAGVCLPLMTEGLRGRLELAT